MKKLRKEEGGKSRRRRVSLVKEEGRRERGEKEGGKKEGNTTRLFASWRGEIFSRSLGRRESRKYLLIISLIGGSTEVGRKDGERGVKEREKGGEVCERLVVRWLAEMEGREREKTEAFYRLPMPVTRRSKESRAPRVGKSC